MTEAIHSYDPAGPHGLAHDPVKALIAPRPIGWMSTINSSGQRNLAPFSFFTLFSSRPILLGFSSSGPSDTLANVRETGEFTWNMVSRPLAAQMNETSATVAADVDEASLAAVQMAASDVVAPERVAQSPVAVECTVTQIVELTTANGSPSGSTLVVGQAVRVHIQRRSLRDGTFDLALADPVFRGGGTSTYYGLAPSTRFELQRPR